MTSTTIKQEWLAAAYELGKDAAETAATWTTDGNESDESRRRKLEMLEAGDPAADDYLPAYPNLSGEWADDPTPNSIAYDVGYRADDFYEPDEVKDAIADEWERGVSEHFMAACEAELHKSVDES